MKFTLVFLNIKYLLSGYRGNKSEVVHNVCGTSIEKCNVLLTTFPVGPLSTDFLEKSPLVARSPGTRGEFSQAAPKTLDFRALAAFGRQICPVQGGKFLKGGISRGNQLMST